MITVEKKLNIFSKLILEKERTKLNEKLQEIKENNEKIIKEKRDKAKVKAKQLIESKVNKGNVEKNAMISKATNEAKNKILNKKKELLDRTVEEIKNKARQFANSQEYENYFLKAVKDALAEFNDGKGISLYILPEDIKRFQEKLNSTIVNSGLKIEDVEIIPSTEDIIGGVIVVNKVQSIRIDASISSTIEEKRETIGYMLYEELIKAGDINE